jgi:glycosyltransferase EpsH
MSISTIPPKNIISFILPIYNVEQFLQKCLCSIEQQTSDYWEAILVDDGSTDNSSAICKEYASKNPKFRYTRQDNQGQGCARNKGIKLAQGTYIFFVDPDDWIEAETTKDLLALMDSSDADFANFGFNFFSEDGNVSRRFNNFTHVELTGSEIFERSMLDREIYSTPWSKIYRASYLQRHNIQFPGLRAYEDLYFSRKVSLHASKCLFIKKIYYHALMRSDSTTRKMSKQSFVDAIKAIEFERSALSISTSQKNEKYLFDAHVLKFTSSLILQAAFRIKDKREFNACIELLCTAGFFVRLPSLNVLNYLTLANKLVVFVSRSTYFTRFAAACLSLVGIKPY